MSYTIDQDSEYVRHNWWKWSVWIEAPAADLDRVSEVTWFLHPSFSNPETTVSDRASKFRLRAQGWGTFKIACTIRLDDDSQVELSHVLEFEYPEGEGRTPPRKGVEGSIVYLVYPSETAKLVRGIRTQLEAEGVKVQDLNDAAPGVPFAVASQKLMRESHAVVAIQDGVRPSDFVQRELEQATKAQVPTLQVMVGGNEGEVAQPAASASRAVFETTQVKTLEDGEPMVREIFGFLDHTR